MIENRWGGCWQLRREVSPSWLVLVLGQGFGFDSRLCLGNECCFILCFPLFLLARGYWTGMLNRKEKNCFCTLVCTACDQNRYCRPVRVTYLQNKSERTCQHPCCCKLRRD
jgi:hypothetical protein